MPKLNFATLSSIIFQTQQVFHRENDLLKDLISLSILTDEQVDVAWREGKKLNGSVGLCINLRVVPTLNREEQITPPIRRLFSD